jgi:hypothetical protein
MNLVKDALHPKAKLPGEQRLALTALRARIKAIEEGGPGDSVFEALERQAEWRAMCHFAGALEWVTGDRVDFANAAAELDRLVFESLLASEARPGSQEPPAGRAPGRAKR